MATLYRYCTTFKKKREYLVISLRMRLFLGNILEHETVETNFISVSNIISFTSSFETIDVNVWQFEVIF